MSWSVPLWSGPCAILASGESMSHVVADTVRRSGVRAIAINTTFRLALWADLLYAADREWWETYHGETAEFAGLKVGCQPTRFDDVQYIKESGKDGFDENPAAIRTGGNGGYAGLHIAAQARANPILLCGFDMRGGNWHGRHPAPLRNVNDEGFPRWIERFRMLAPELKRRGIEVLNCTPDSALPWFPMVELEDALARTLSAA